MTQEKQIVTAEFKKWLDSTSFAGVVKVGDQWDAELAWPTRDLMDAARESYALFCAGELAGAEEAMWVAQAPFV